MPRAYLSYILQNFLKGNMSCSELNTPRCLNYGDHLDCKLEVRLRMLRFRKAYVLRIYGFIYLKVSRLALLVSDLPMKV